MRAWRADLDLRLRNPQLPDAIARVGRDPLRKLGPEDRLVGAARLCLAEGVPPDPILVGIAAALRYAAATEGEHPAVRLLASDPQEAVRRLTGQGPETALGQAICRMQAETPARSFAPG
ncbi:MAG: hypothetical protein FJX77_12380 [Armatimonadetes bacterium]|nr:hypothetical protein [Armatimonadota bacterium]